jgi:hypothetical protein
VRTSARYEAITDAYSAREDAAQIAAWLAEWRLTQSRRGRELVQVWKEYDDAVV